MKAKALSFVFISFSESGLFNALQPIQIKNFFPLCASRSRLHIVPAAIRRRRHALKDHTPTSRKSITRFLFFRKKMRQPDDLLHGTAAVPWPHC
jgi:hypothetical protein